METDRLELHLETEADFDAIYAMLAQIYPPDYSPERDDLREEQHFYRLMRKGMFGGLFGRWIVKQKNSGALVGLGMLVPHLCTPAESAALNGSATPGRHLEVEVGWALARPYRKQGFGTETGRMLLRHAFADIGLHRVIGITDTDNPDSMRLMSRLGMQIVTLPNSTEVLGWVTMEMFRSTSG